MKNTIEDNLTAWDREHHWSRDGDEWDGQAIFSGVPYQQWKESLVKAFLSPHLGPDVDVVEIAPGHGRWTEFIVGNCRSLTLVDLSPSCIEHCKDRFRAHNHITYRITDGNTLPLVAEGSVDFIWSFDSFVHMAPDVISAYFREAARALRPGGTMTIHHAGRRHTTLFLGVLKNLGVRGRTLYQWISMGKFKDDDGWRSDVSPQLIQRLARDAGLKTTGQVQTWGDTGQCNVRRYNDWITTLQKDTRS